MAGSGSDNRYLTPCDRCKRIFCNMRIEFLRKYAFSMFDNPVECPDIDEDEPSYHGLDGVRP